MDKLSQYYQANIGLSIKKGLLVDPDYDCLNISTGWKPDLQNYEFHSKTIDNLFYGLYHRFFASHLYLDDIELDMFSDFCKNVYLPPIKKKIENFDYSYVRDYNPMKDINSRESFSQSKKDAYMK